MWYNLLMQYKVPQDVQRADQILWFITLKQLIFIIIGGGISYALFTGLSKKYVLGVFEIILICIPAAIALAFAFVRIKGLSLFKIGLLLIETSLFRAPRRYWQTSGDVFVSMTTGFSEKKVEKKTPLRQKDVSDQKIKNLADLIDKNSKKNEA